MGMQRRCPGWLGCLALLVAAASMPARAAAQSPPPTSPAEAPEPAPSQVEPAVPELAVPAPPETTTPPTAAAEPVSETAVEPTRALPEPPEPPAAAIAPPAGLQFSGDLGVRVMIMLNERFASNDETADDDLWVVPRFRVRFGAEYRPAEWISLFFRLATGDPSYPPSSWQFALHDLRKFPISIDRAYAELRPGTFATIRFGAHPNPLFTPTEILWDGDVHPIGLSEVFKLGDTGLEVRAAQVAMRELRDTLSSTANKDDAWLLAGQLLYSPPGLSVLKPTFGLAGYWFTNPNTAARAIQTAEFSGDFKTNRFDPRGEDVPDPNDPEGTIPIDYFSDFRLLDVSMRLEAPSLKLTLDADFVWNFGARRAPSLGPMYEDRKALAVGAMLRYGSLNEPGDWQVGVGFFHIESDAAIAVYNNDEMQQTGIQSFPVEVSVALASKVKLVVDAYVSRREDTDLPISGGIVHDENAARVRANLRLLGSF